MLATDGSREGSAWENSVESLSAELQSGAVSVVFLLSLIPSVLAWGIYLLSSCVLGCLSRGRLS